MAEHDIGSNKHNEAIAKALKQVSAHGTDLIDGDSAAREKLIASARELVAVAETPVETLLWNIWAPPTRSVALRIAVDLKVFETAVQDDGRPKSDAEFATPTAASPILVKRITRVCASMHMLEEKSSGLYAPNALTRLLARPEYTGSWDCAQPSFAHMPTYLKNTQFKNPQNPTDGPFQYGQKYPGHGFGWLTDHPDVFQAFHHYAYTLRKHRPNWVEMYPVHDRHISGPRENDSSVLVDIGGGTGQILQDFRKSTPEYAGRLVLQEVPEVIAVAQGMELDKSTNIELQVHDFFTPQPIKGARAYFMRSVLHDWADEQCRVILGHLRDAMEPGYSRILINDCVLADEHAAWQHISLDIFMMALASAQERTESEWHALIDSCGLKIAGIYNKGEGNEGMIEVILE
ncbi:S-adenosyl-L-methionine-dependent methyltransferase [Lophiostoma macrostomum CBS 122681]|uniref:S-adenosyl-L-methionine-dependent methyltransferase n=1 Tax=Lophiostoma macrostomum CBS 122681 TaxID=1314788 RepID=A0A6A6T7E2_9PLEO|nr:S-adenosyl-L-methionine-dependent methyltransferase [Lophiostoma macrostomum CBS 122681]